MKCLAMFLVMNHTMMCKQRSTTKAQDVKLNEKPHKKKTPKPSLMPSMGEADEIDQ